MTTLNNNQLKNGKDMEAWLDKFFRLRGWQITQTTPYQERVLYLGDRHFVKDGMHLLIEYKGDLKTAYTQNIFLETISVDSVQKPGWVYSCRADIIFYAALLNHKILVFRPEKLRQQIDGLKRKFPEVATQKHLNEGYNTHGLLVPFVYAEERLAEKVIRV